MPFDTAGQEFFTVFTWLTALPFIALAIFLAL